MTEIKEDALVALDDQYKDMMSLSVDDLKDLQIYTKHLNKSPDKTKIMKLDVGGGRQILYLPISHIEMLLDQYFFGLWETFNFKWQLIANEVVASIQLKVYHPKLHIWLTRTGTGSVPIQQTSGSKIADILHEKIKNTLVKDFPHLEAECIKSAAHKLGKVFGRDLNRKEEDFYTPIIPDESTKPVN